MGFLEQMAEQNNVAVTENGALGYATTQDPLTDMLFMVSAMRNAAKDGSNERWNDFLSSFILSMAQDPALTMQFLYYIRDIEHGLGERDLYRSLFDYAGHNILSGKNLQPLLDIIPDYGRYDDFVQLGLKLAPEHTAELLDNQLAEDLAKAEQGESCTLLAKWMPSVNASSTKTRQLAHKYLSLSKRYAGRFGRKLAINCLS